MSGHSAELRRYPRARASWRVAVEMPGGRTLNRETIDVGPHGVKVRLDETVGAGSRVRLRFQPRPRTSSASSHSWTITAAVDGRGGSPPLPAPAPRPTRFLALVGQSPRHRDLVCHFCGKACH